MSIDVQKLKVDVEEKDRWRRTLNVTVPASIVSTEREKILERLGGRLKLPGFRSGRVPASVVEKRYGPAVRREMLDQVIGDAYKEVLRSRSLTPISEGEVDDVSWEPDEDLVFSISFDVRPEIELGRLGGFAVERPSSEVGDEEVDRVLDRLRDQNAAWSPVEEGKPEAGDLASISVVKLVDGEPEGEAQDYDLELGEGVAIPDVENAIRTLEPGESGDFDVTFPDDFPTEEKRGKTERMRVTLHTRKVRDRPELDDAFARSLGDFDDLEDLRAKIAEDLGEEAESRQKQAVRGQILERILEANAFDVPASMVERYIESVMGDTDDVDPDQVAEARVRIRPEAERAVKRFLVLERIAETQGLRATEDEIDERIEEIAEKNDMSPSELYGRLQKSGRLEQIERDITETKVFDFLEQQSEIVDAR